MAELRIFETGTKTPLTGPLNRVLISWDFYEDIKDDRDSTIEKEQEILERGLASSLCNYDIKNDKNRVPGEIARLRKLPTTFADDNEYLNTLLPVFLLETKQAMFRAKEMEIDPPEKLVQVDVSSGPNHSFFITLQKLQNSDRFYGAGDMVLLYLNPPSDAGGVVDGGVVDTDQVTAGGGKDEKEFNTDDAAKGKEKATVSGGGGKRDAKRAAAAKTFCSESLLPPDPLINNPYHILAVVENATRDCITVMAVIPNLVYLSGQDEARLTEEEIWRRKRLQRRMLKMADAMMEPSTSWNIARLMGLATIHREFQALMTFSELFLEKNILLRDFLSDEKLISKSAEDNSSPDANSSSSRKKLVKKKQNQQTEKTPPEPPKEVLYIPPTLTCALEELYNDSQMSTLKECLKATGITLIQGPPGTGKTTTITGVLSVILNASVVHSASERLERDKAMDDVDSNVILEQSSCTPTSTSDGQVQVLSMQSTPSAGNVLHNNTALNNNKLMLTAAHKRLLKTQPWLWKSDYAPWYDEVKITFEDLEDHKSYLMACNRRDEVVNLSNFESDSQPKRILVCAPSNAAIDEILKRLTSNPQTGGGVFDKEGRRYNPPVVRVGPNVHPDLLDYSLENRVNARIQSIGNTASLSKDIIKTSLLKECRIVCTTLSVAGCRDLSNFPDGFDTVVVDEASQCVELAILVPLKLGCRRLILVGDPRQLPATVFSKIAIEMNYDQSLFQRFEKAAYKINMLSVQYRMHPDISLFPSQTFYGGTLLDAPNILDIAKPPFDWYSVPIFKPVTFFAIDSKETAKDNSMVNLDECDFICQLVELLGYMLSEIHSSAAAATPTTAFARANTSTAQFNWHSQVAVISPYAEQVRLIRKQLKILLQVPDSRPCPIDVNTVDGFQGREKDLVIFSAVRAKFIGDGEVTKANVGFLADVRRMNVALTRARLNLWVVGNGRYLMGNPEWAKFWNHTAKHNFQFNVNFSRIPRNGYLKRWLACYFTRSPTAVELLKSKVPKFVAKVEKDVRELTAKDTTSCQLDEAVRQSLEHDVTAEEMRKAADHQYDLEIDSMVTDETIDLDPVLLKMREEKMKEWRKASPVKLAV